MVLSNIPYAVGSRLNEKDDPSHDIVITYKAIGPLLKTTWNQSYPYNMYMPYCTCRDCLSGNWLRRALVGCTNVAKGQVIAYFGKFVANTSENSNIDFKQITKEPIPNASTQDQIAHFLYEIAVRNNSNFGHGATGAREVNAYNLLLACGYDCDYVKGNASSERLKQHICSKGSPSIYVGFTDANEGHAWVIDGYQFSNPEQFHCNWGWGGYSDGWAEYKAMTHPEKEPESTSYYKKNKTIYINEQKNLLAK